ncbi:PQQ-dependent sugar dehydrogenase [Chondrinema litorale]|uniref:PQQ-dependent sugar dehydrogenase n=1 Tax=Chondrinema litorale TaxID=2994555 RepID=UPI0025434159|nr:PQQ-dependent sugar dehydrogenase [Chondrinema litorale]UZR95361.1 PQQ-dependent sugar dehydrogenase [Chondrinema litorale]
MRRLIFFILLSCLLTSCNNENKRVLLVFDPTGSQAQEIISIALKDKSIELDTTTSISYIHEDTLKSYPYLVLVGVDGKELNAKQQNHLERYVQASGELILIGTNINPKYQWPWYDKLASKINDNIQNPSVIRSVKTSIGEFDKNIQVNFDGGNIKLFPLVGSSINKIWEGIVEKPLPDYNLAHTLRMPEENRFVRVVLDAEVNKPIDLTIMPNGKVIFIESEGNVKLHNPETGKTKLLTIFEVNPSSDNTAGLLGVELDPNFINNGWIYFYYSVSGDKQVQRLSRFFMAADSLLKDTERIILEVPTQKENCCYAGGSIKFGPDGLLYLSTAEGTSSIESDGLLLLDDRTNKSTVDSLNYSVNVNDLRGKILRIKVNDDGTYSIPDGNLFPKDDSKGKPEIYVMGVRNPFRIFIDQKNGSLYWGDVGPELEMTQSYDEFNRAKESSNYGWPYFIADNKVYPNFETNTFGENLDSIIHPNDTEKAILPKAQVPLIWYSYSESDLWPILGKGAKKAMAGPVYYSDMYPNSKKKFPKYYDGKWFIYEQARNWIMTVSFDGNDKVEKIEPFLSDMLLSKPIDLEFGPDGTMYLLEYGANNDDAKIVKIEYIDGNRAPIANIKSDVKAGTAPLVVHFSAGGSYDFDPDDELSYRWVVEETNDKEKGNEVDFKFKKEGIYTVKLIAKDDKGKSTEAFTTIKVGNEPPKINIEISGNSSYYYDSIDISYKISVTDKEDAEIDRDKIKVAFEYLPSRKDLALLSSNSLEVLPYLKGKTLIDKSDCASCHSINEPSIGPSYKDISERYRVNDKTINELTQKVILGGKGNWGQNIMNAHPQHSVEETTAMVEYILSLENNISQLPLQGSVLLDKHLEKEEGVYVFSVSYTDHGTNNISPLSTNKLLILKVPKVEAESYEVYKHVSRKRSNDGTFSYVSDIKDQSYFVLKNIDLKDIGSITYHISNQMAGATISVYQDAPDGEMISIMTMGLEDHNGEFRDFTAPVNPTNGVHNLYFTFTHPEEKHKTLFLVDWVQFNIRGDL